MSEQNRSSLPADDEVEGHGMKPGRGVKPGREDGTDDVEGHGMKPGR